VLERAISEYLQMGTLYTDEHKFEDSIVVEFLSKSNALQRLIQIPVAEFDKSSLNLESRHEQLDPTEMIDLILGNYLVDMPCYQRDKKSFSCGATVTQCYIPGMDRFNLIRLGNLVAPQKVLLGNA